MTKVLNILILAPYLDSEDVGEAYCAFKWVQTLSAHAHVTLLTMQRPGWQDKRSILPNVQTFWCNEPWVYRLVPRLNAMAKLSYGTFYRWARATISRMVANGYPIDIAHQLTPFALRHASPLRHFHIPYVLGPKAGSLATPKAMAAEMDADPLYMKLRNLDILRFYADRGLRQSYQKASLVMGAAPYVGARLDKLAQDRFVVESELGLDALPEMPDRSNRIGTRLLHIGRGVRSKGLRDVIQAMARLNPALAVHLDVAGQGPEIEACQALAADMGLAERITFHGQVGRERITSLYRAADIFCFPSFREPSGSVIFEAMSHGLPIIGAAVGGPAHVITPKTGMLIEPQKPSDFADDIARAIARLAIDPALCTRMGAAARARVAALGLWHAKADRMMALYRAVIHEQQEQQANSKESIDGKSAHA